MQMQVTCCDNRFIISIEPSTNECITTLKATQAIQLNMSMYREVPLDNIEALWCQLQEAIQRVPKASAVHGASAGADDDSITLSCD